MTDAKKLPRHKFWGAGEPGCPPELKAPNGELHTMRCKVCGDGWRESTDVCLVALGGPELTLRELDAIGHPYFNGPLNSNEEMFGRAVERAVRRRLLGTAGVAPSQAAQPPQNQCDGCMRGAELRDNGLHYDRHGKAFMSCQRARYANGVGGTDAA